MKATIEFNGDMTTQVNDLFANMSPEDKRAVAAQVMLALVSSDATNTAYRRQQAITLVMEEGNSYTRTPEAVGQYEIDRKINRCPSLLETLAAAMKETVQAQMAEYVKTRIAETPELDKVMQDAAKNMNDNLPGMVQMAMGQFFGQFMSGFFQKLYRAGPSGLCSNHPTRGLSASRPFC